MCNSNSVDILVPNLPESVTDAIVAVWHKKEGDTVQLNEILLELETDKIMMEVPSPTQGIVEMILEQEGAIVVAGQILGRLKLNDDVIVNKIGVDNIVENNNDIKSVSKHDIIESDQYIANDSSNTVIMSPAIRKLIAESGLNVQSLKGSGIKGRITRKDIEMYLHKKSSTIDIVEKSDINDVVITTDSIDKCDMVNYNTENLVKQNNPRIDKRVKMSRLRKTISDRLLKAVHSTAMLTTFNEVNMKPVMILRNKYKDLFIQHHQTKLGFLSFYVKAVSEGLRKFSDINAAIDGEDIIYHNYFDISIAVATERGLVTPVLRDVNVLNISDIEKKIKFFVQKGKDGKLTFEELKGGNFTITNGGVFGSLMSTPIINPPQSAILGMHAIKERPVVLNNKIVILPMMYLALSYDHRLIDGKDAVLFLVTIKELIEDPMRLLLDV